jgi:hypothetical protein
MTFLQGEVALLALPYPCNGATLVTERNGQQPSQPSEVRQEAEAFQASTRSGYRAARNRRARWSDVSRISRLR